MREVGYYKSVLICYDVREWWRLEDEFGIVVFDRINM